MDDGRCCTSNGKLIVLFAVLIILIFVYLIETKGAVNDLNLSIDGEVQEQQFCGSTLSDDCKNVTEGSE